MYCARKIIHSVGSFFFFSVQNYQLFFSKINDSSGPEQQGSQAVGPVSSLCRAKFFFDFLTFVRNYNGYHGIIGRTTAF